MKTILFLFFIFSASANSSLDKFKNDLRLDLINSHHPITYQQANEILFTKLDNKNGIICSVYNKNNCLTTIVIPSPKVMNIEHTWPQSLGANGEAKSDLHHIFISDSPTNSIRSSLPFCDVMTVKWTNGESKRGRGKFGEHCFEPPQNHKGNVARAMFYFAIRYQKEIDSQQEFYFRLWHKIDPVDENESNRNAEIEKFQGNSNPFVTHPEYTDTISDF